MPPLLAVLVLLALLPAVGHAGPVQDALAAKFPGVEPENVRPTPIPGIWEIAVGGQVVYLSEDGQYMLRGDVVDLETGRSIAEGRQAELRLEISKQFDEQRMIVFSPEKPKHTITVFTDIDCGYCRKLHREMADLNKLGIKVRYAFYPRAGPGSDSWAKADAVWCAPDRNDALTRAKLGEHVVAAKACSNTPVADQYRLGNELGIRGTPAIMTEGGDLLPGYVPADELAAWLDGN